MATAHFDALETRDPQAREAALLAALPAQLAHARASSPAQALRLGGIDPAAVRTREDLARLPVLRKHELLDHQRARQGGDPFGGYAAAGWTGLRLPRAARRVFQSPGPIYEPQGRAADGWRMARALHAAGLRAGDLVHNSFSYHLTPAGAMMEEGALALGCTVFPGGVGNTDLQLQALADLGAQAWCGTPSFLRILLERADEQGVALPSLRRALVSGEAFTPSMREWLRQRGVEGFQCYATADLGLIAYETEAREGLVVDEQILLEIVRPGTGIPVAPGEVGEVVVTTFDADYPLIRFGTGDLSAVLEGPCPTGRTQTRIKGWMGRADQSTKVRGMFVHASQVGEVLRRHPAVAKARLVVDGEMPTERITLHAEAAPLEPGVTTLLREQLGISLREVTKLRVEVNLVAPASLPNDGLVIEDRRSYR